MDIRIGANVQCSDGPGGHVSCIILNPVSERVTDIVINEPGLLGDRVVVPIEKVTQQTPEMITLNLTRDELADMPGFLTSRYHVPGDNILNTPYWRVYPLGGLYMSPYLEMEEAAYSMLHEDIPLGELAMHRGDGVEATDGRVGEVEGFIVNQQNDGITHVVLREGHLWGAKDVTIPVSDIERIENGSVQLKLTKQEVAALPAVGIRRRD